MIPLENPTNTSQIKLGIIEDDKVIQTNLMRYLELSGQIKISVSAFSVEEYFSKIQENLTLQSDVLLLDIGLPGMSGLDAIEPILKQNEGLSIIILTTFEDESMILKAMCSGAVAYISKKTSLKKIEEAIKIVANGGSYMSPNIARDIFNYMVKSKENTSDKLLSKRQKEVLEKLVEGLSYTQIGKALFISPETVRTHIKNIYKALHVNNKVEAIKKYLSSDLYGSK